jgi:hypothetical protein
MTVLADRFPVTVDIAQFFDFRLPRLANRALETANFRDEYQQLLRTDRLMPMTADHRFDGPSQ